MERCCGNCRFYDPCAEYCDIVDYSVSPGDSCDSWDYDGVGSETMYSETMFEPQDCAIQEANANGEENS